jgi:RNA polymerase sigma factor (sigma-70 family)
MSGFRPSGDFISLTSFEELPEQRLNGLDDDGLIAYVREARDAGAQEAMRQALAVLVHGYWDLLVARACLKLPVSDAEDVAAETIASAIASAFDGRSVGEFRSWLQTILSRRIADYHEARKRRPQTETLADEADDDTWGHEPAVPFEGDALFARECLEQAYGELEQASHRQVIDLYVLGPCSAADAAARVDGMTEANVHQVASRFQRRVRHLLDEGDTAG